MFFLSVVDLKILIPFFLALAASSTIPLYIFILNRKKIFRIQCDIDKFIPDLKQKKYVFPINIINESREVHIIEKILLDINAKHVVEIFNSEENPLIASPQQFCKVDSQGILFKNPSHQNNAATKNIVFYFQEKEKIIFSFIIFKISGEYYKSAGTVPYHNKFTKVLFSKIPYEKKDIDIADKNVLKPQIRNIKKSDILCVLPHKIVSDKSLEIVLLVRNYIETRWIFQSDFPKDIKLVCSEWRTLKGHIMQLRERITHSLFNNF